MFLRWIFAALHLLGLGIGLGAVWTRARALRGPLDIPALRRVFSADAWWAVAAAVWISTGLVRVLAGLEKRMDYYLQNHVFWGKMTLLLAILILEISPIVLLTRWRAQVRRGEMPDTRPAGRLATISYVQVVLVLLMVLAATAMARGIGMASELSGDSVDTRRIGSLEVSVVGLGCINFGMRLNQKAHGRGDRVGPRRTDQLLRHLRLVRTQRGVSGQGPGIPPQGRHHRHQVREAGAGPGRGRHAGIRQAGRGRQPAPAPHRLHRSLPASRAGAVGADRGDPGGARQPGARRQGAGNRLLQLLGGADPRGHPIGAAPRAPASSASRTSTACCSAPRRAKSWGPAKSWA